MILKASLKKRLTKWLLKERYTPAVPLSDFGRLQYECRPGDVILVEGTSRVSYVIRNLTHSPWTHAALYIGRLYDIEDIALRKIILHFYPQAGKHPLIIEGLLGEGTIVSPLEKYQKMHMRICRPRGIAYQDAQAVVSYAVKKIGTDYYVRQIFDLARFLLPWSILPRRWLSSLFSNDPQAKGEVCSSIIVKAFMSVNFPVLPHMHYDEESGKLSLTQRNFRLFTPSDFDYSPYFDIVKYPLLDLNNQPIYKYIPWEKTPPPQEI